MGAGQNLGLHVGFEGPCSVKLSKAQLEGQHRLETLKGENLDLLGVSNFVSILGVVHKANKNHWSVPWKQSSLIKLRMQGSLFFERQW